MVQQLAKAQDELAASRRMIQGHEQELSALRAVAALDADQQQSEHWHGARARIWRRSSRRSALMMRSD
jgi:hypothetical protein